MTAHARSEKDTDWQRLSPRMLLVHPVHEVLRQLPVLVGSVVLGSSTGNSAWPLTALGVIVGFGLLRWVFTTYRISDEYVELRTGVLQRRSISVPRNRIRSVQTDSRLLHRLLGLTVLRVGTGQQARGEAAFALDAVEAVQVPRLRATLLAESLDVPEQPAGRVLARWHPSWLRYAPLSFSGLGLIAAVIGVAYQVGGITLSERIAKAGSEAAHRTGLVMAVSRGGGRRAAGLGAAGGAVVVADLRRAGAAPRLGRAASTSRCAAGAGAHVRHAPAARRHAAGAAVGAGVAVVHGWTR